QKEHMVSALSRSKLEAIAGYFLLLSSDEADLFQILGKFSFLVVRRQNEEGLRSLCVKKLMLEGMTPLVCDRDRFVLLDRMLLGKQNMKMGQGRAGEESEQAERQTQIQSVLHVILLGTGRPYCTGYRPMVIIRI